MCVYTVYVGVSNYFVYNEHLQAHDIYNLITQLLEGLFSDLITDVTSTHGIFKLPVIHLL